VLAVQEFALHRGPERFDQRVVDIGSNTPHGTKECRCAEPVAQNPSTDLSQRCQSHTIDSACESLFGVSIATRVQCQTGRQDHARRLSVMPVP
jgi:hypothetical protein